MNDGSLSVSNMLHRELGIGKGEGGGVEFSRNGPIPKLQKSDDDDFHNKRFLCVVVRLCEPS